MKHFLLTLLTFTLSFTYSVADELIISPNNLPSNIKTFINQYFPGTDIMYAEIDYNEYEIRLNSGAEIEFYKSGEWKEIKTYQNFPIEVLPSDAVKTIKNTAPNSSIIKAEKIWSGYEIKTSSMMEIYIDKDGKLLGQKHDF